MIEQLGTKLNWHFIKENKPPQLSNSELHLWWLTLNISEKQKAFTLTILNERQRDKFERRTTKTAKDAYLAGRYYLFTLLAHYSNCEPGNITLSYSRLKKPSLIDSRADKDSGKIHFNFTDTSVNNKIYGLFAFCRDREIGVDLESLSRDGAFQKIARRRFTKDEIKYVSDESGTFNRQRSLAIWTRKEAYGKAIGQGINFQMNQRNLVGKDVFEYNFNDGQDDWRLLQLQPNPDFIASVVHQGHQELEIKAFNRPYIIA